ncbi:MAG: sulfotransferase [Phycisphaeraceae bacterium]
MHAELERYLQRPIVILGAPRSGTTFIGKVLAQHPDLAYVVEPRLIWKDGNDLRSDLLRPEHLTPAIRSRIRSSLAQRVHNANRSRLLEKTPSNSIRPGFVDAVLPDAIYIHIIRNGYDAVLSSDKLWDKSGHGVTNVAVGHTRRRLKELSWLRMPFYAPEYLRRMTPKPLKKLVGENPWGPRLPGIHQMLREMDRLQVACLQWKWCVELSCAFGRTLGPDRYYEVRLEDLSEEKTREIIAFCDLSPNDAMEQFIREHYDAERAGRHSSAVDPQAIRNLAPWIEPTNQWLGYPPTPTPSIPV